MKKILSIIVVSLILSVNANATRLKGINEVDLLVEIYGNIKECSVKKESIVTAVKYILQNSKIKIKKDDAYVPMLYVAVGAIKSGGICTAYIDIRVEAFPAKDPLGLNNSGYFVYYRNGSLTSGGSQSEFLNSVVNGVEKIMKDLVVKHHKDNS